MDMDYCVPCTISTNASVDPTKDSLDPLIIDDTKLLQFPYIQKHASQLVIYDVCSGKGRTL